MAITKKIRFEVFKRDGFKCGYCGKNPPEVTLEVDHIDPRANGGDDDMNNLITACFACNRGKKHIPLEKIPPKLQENLEVLREQEDQIKEYRKFIKKVEGRKNKDIEKIEHIFTKSFPGYGFSETFRAVSVKKFLNLLPLYEVEDAMQRAISKFPRNFSGDRDNATKYFCGICWNKIKNPQ